MRPFYLLFGLVFLGAGLWSIPRRRPLEELEYRTARLLFRVPFDQNSRLAGAARKMMAITRPTVMIIGGIAMVAIGLGLVTPAK